MKYLSISVAVLLSFVTVPLVSAKISLRLNIVDGKTNKTVLNISSSQKSANTKDINVEIKPTSIKTSESKRWDFTIKNNSSNDCKLYLNWQLIWNKTTDINKLHYWYGRGEPITGNRLLQQPYTNNKRNSTMLQAIYNNKDGVALALPPMQIVSALNQSLISKNNKFILQLQIPLALSPGQSDTFPIEVYKFKPQYGYLNALREYYLAHPKAFSTRANIDPRTAGVGGSRTWTDLVSKGLDKIDSDGLLKATAKVQRFHTDWDWFYAPFRRTGDIYTRNKYWDYKPVKPFNYFRDQPSAEKFREFRNQILSLVNKAGAAPAFYVPSFLYCEIELAKKQYPGAIIYNSDGSYAKLYTTPWVITNDHEVEMYPWGNKFAKQSMKDAQQIVAENNVPAFGYDIMGGGKKFRGKGMKESPRRAFDKHGEYVDTSVAIAKMADFTRNLENNGKKVGLVGNATSTSRPFLVARSDTLMCEQPPYFYGAHLYSQDGSVRAERYAAGHKIITFWSAWKLPRILKTKQMTPKQLRQAYRGAADFVRLSCYRFGAYPSIRFSAGVPKMVKMLPLLKEVIKRGWQVVPAVRGDNKALPSSIWTARYGNGLKSFITLGNAQKKNWDGEIIIDNKYLGNKNYLFVALNSSKILSQKVQNHKTILSVDIPSRDTLVLSAVASVAQTSSGNTKVAWKDNSANGTLTIEGELKTVKVNSPRSGWNLKKHENQAWDFASNYFASPASTLQSFPYFDDNKVAQIVLPRNPTNNELWAAHHIQDYFKFWGQYGMKKRQKITLPILHTSDKIDTSVPKILIKNNSNLIKRDNNKLVISGSNLRESTKKLLDILDKKYFYAVTLTTRGADGKALKKAGLAGKTLNLK